MTVRWLTLLVCAAACSTPAKKQDPPPTPADDEGSAVAWQAANPPPDAAPPVYTFDWDKARVFTEKVRTSRPGDLPCDFRIKGPRPKGQECIPGKGGVLLAATVRTKVAIDDTSSQVVLDIGANAGLTKEWYGALLDKDNHLQTGWRRLDEVHANMAWLTVELPHHQTRFDQHVALISEVPK